MARSKIKGITIEIGGNTTKLDKALQKAGEGSRDLQLELKEVNKLLKMDPTNTELLTQKQAILKEQIKKTSDSLDILRNAEKQVQEQFEKGEITEEQYRVLKRTIASTAQELKQLEKEAEQTEKALKNAGKKSEDIEKLGESADKAKGKLSAIWDTVKKGMAVVGTAIASAGTYSVKFEKDYQQALNTAAGATGATAQEIEGLDKAMEAVYTNNFGENIQEVGEAMGIVAQQTNELDPSKLQEMTESAFTLQDTFDMDIQESMRAVNQLMTQFGIDGEQAFDLIVSGAQNGLNKNDNLLDSINEYGPKFAQVGLTATDMFNMFQNGAEAGVFDIDKLGDAMNEFSIRVKDGTADNAFKDLRIDADAAKAAFAQGGDAAKQATQDIFNALQNVSDPLEQNRIGVELFGTMWEDTGGKAILAMGNMAGEADNAAGKMEELKQIRYDDLGSQFESVGRAIQTELVKPLGEELTPAISDALDTVEEKIPEAKEIVSDVITNVKDFISFFLQNSGTMIALIGGIAAGFIGWNIVTMIQGLISAFKGWKTATEGVTIAQKILNSTFRKNPIGIIVTAVMGLITTLVLLYNKCEWFREGVNNILKSVAQFFKDAWKAIQDAWAAAQPYFQAIWEGIKSIFSVVAAVLGGFFSAAWNAIQTIWNVVVGFFQGIWNGIKTVFSVVAAVLGGFFSAAWTIIQTIWNGVVGYFQNVWNGVKTVFSVVATVLGGFFSVAWNAIQTVWNVVVSYYQGIWNGIKAIFSVVQEVLLGFFRGAWETIKGVWSSATNWFGDVWNGIKNVFSSVKDWFSDIFRSAWDAVKNVFADWGSFFGGLWDRIKDTFSNLGTSIADAIGGAVRSGINGVISTIENTINGAINLINGAIGLINKLPGVSVGTIGHLNLPYLAKGGTLKEGSAIMAEAGPELIQIVNGEAVVTPLSRSAKNTPVAAGTGGFVQNLNITSPKPLTPYEVARQTRNATRQVVLSLKRK